MRNKQNELYSNKSNLMIQNYAWDLKEKQLKMIKLFEKITPILENINSNIEHLQDVLKKHIMFEDKINEIVPLSSILSYVSRNDALSEEGVYKLLTSGTPTVKVLSGSTNNIEYGQIPNNIDKIHYLDDRQGLHIVTRGKAGKITYVPKGSYATNTNAFLLFINSKVLNDLNIKNDEEEMYYLKYLALFLQADFYKLISNADVSVFPLTDTMKTFMIPKFRYNKKMINIVEKIDKLKTIERSLNSKKQELLNLSNKKLLA